MLYTKDLELKRDELKDYLVYNFNLTFEKEIEDFEELTKIVNSSEDKDIKEWAFDNNEDFDHIEEVDYVEENALDFRYGGILIEDVEFEDYCRDLVEECYDLSNVPEFIKNNINWVGVNSALMVDYSEIKYQGKTYFYGAY